MGFDNLAEARVMLRENKRALLEQQPGIPWGDTLCTGTRCTVCKKVFPPEGFCCLDRAERRKRIYALTEQEDLP